MHGLLLDHFPDQKAITMHAFAFVAHLVGIVAVQPPLPFVPNQSLDDHFALVVDGKYGPILWLRRERVDHHNVSIV